MPKKLSEGIKDYLDDLRKEECAKSTLKNFGLILGGFENFIGSYEFISDISDEQVQTYYQSDMVLKTNRDNPAKENTIRKKEQLIKRMMEYFKQKGWTMTSKTPPKTRNIPRSSSVENATKPKTKQPQAISVAGKILDDGVKFINDQLNKAADSMIEIGRYLLKNFFDGDPSKAHDKSGHKGLSLHQLADHPDVMMSFSSLQRAMELASYEKKYFTDSTLGQLSSSHKILLLRLVKNSPQLINKYGKQAVNEGLSVRKLQDLLIADGLIALKGIRSLNPNQEQLVQLGLSQIVSPLDSFLKATLDRFNDKVSQLNDVPDQAVKTTLDKLKQAKDKIEEFIDQLEKRL